MSGLGSEWVAVSMVARTTLADRVEVFTARMVSDGVPELFETTISGGLLDRRCWQWPTRDKASVGHLRAVMSAQLAALFREGNVADCRDLTSTIVDFFVRPDQDPEIDMKVLEEMIHRLPGGPLGSAGVRDSLGRDLIMTRAMGALMFLVCDDECRRREGVERGTVV